MADFNERQKTLTCKIVYYGPAMSGKTTNLMQLHDQVRPADRGEFMSFETKGDRTLFFDLLPMQITSERGFRVIFKLFTVPGQVAHDATRKVVLSRADGVVFVADSQASQALNNFESFDNLEKNIERVGLDPEKLPMVIQFNKRDLADIVPEKEIIARWGPTGLPVLFGSALHGRGVMETFAASLEKTFDALDAAYGLTRRWGLCVHDFLRMFPDGTANGGPTARPWRG